MLCMEFLDHLGHLLQVICRFPCTFLLRKSFPFHQVVKFAILQLAVFYVFNFPFWIVSFDHRPWPGMSDPIWDWIFLIRPELDCIEDRVDLHSCRQPQLVGIWTNNFKYFKGSKSLVIQFFGGPFSLKILSIQPNLVS